MDVVHVRDAVGHVLCHDLTKIVPGEFKGPVFKKGHIIHPEDIEELLKMGKEHLYVWKLEKGQVHENEGGLRLARAVCGPGMHLTEPSEGKVQLIADYNGLCRIDEARLLEVNMIDELIVATRNHFRPVKKGDVVAGARVIPLVIDEAKLLRVEKIGLTGPIISVQPFRPRSVGIITTGSEVYHGRIKDKFGPVVCRKVEEYGCRVLPQIIVSDDDKQITQSVKKLQDEGAELILVTGGMSVDPDDVTPLGIRRTGAEIITYGAPVLPGAMLLIAYLGELPVLGLPGCVMYSKTTVFDLVLPLILSGQKITRPMIAKWGMGGLCLECKVCHYPDCTFGTGA